MPSLLDMERATLACWLTRFVLEMRKTDGTEYPPNTMHHIVCGVMRHLRCTKPDIDFFKDAEFSSFRSSLDAEMKRLQSKGLGSNHKQAESLTVQEEEQLWEKNILGDHSPESLLNTIIFMNGLYFALRSGDEHRQLRHKPCQIQVVENEGERPYLLYTEDIQRTTWEDLKDENSSPKLLCITLILRTRTDALSASSRSTMLSAHTIVLKVHFIFHHSRIPKRTVGTLLHLFGETNSPKPFQTCAKSVGSRGFEQTTHYVLQGQPACTLQVLTNNLLWSEQDIEALRVFVLTSIHLVSSNKLCLIFLPTQRSIAQMLPFHS